MPGLDKSSGKAREREKKVREGKRKKDIEEERGREARILTLPELFSFAEIKHCRCEKLSRRIRAEWRTKTRGKRNMGKARGRGKESESNRKREWEETGLRAERKKFESFQIRTNVGSGKYRTFQGKRSEGIKLNGPK